MRVCHIVPTAYLNYGYENSSFWLVPQSMILNPQWEAIANRCKEDGKHLAVLFDSDKLLDFMPETVKQCVEYGANELICPISTNALVFAKKVLEELEKYKEDERPILTATPAGNTCTEYEQSFMEVYSLNDKIKRLAFPYPMVAERGAEFIGSKNHPARLHLAKKRLSRYMDMAKLSGVLLGAGSAVCLEINDFMVNGLADSIATDAAFSLALDGVHIKDKPYESPEPKPIDFNVKLSTTTSLSSFKIMEKPVLDLTLENMKAINAFAIGT